MSSQDWNLIYTVHLLGVFRFKKKEKLDDKNDGSFVIFDYSYLINIFYFIYIYDRICKASWEIMKSQKYGKIGLKKR